MAAPTFPGQQPQQVPPQSGPKELPNNTLLCKWGQEIVQDIVLKTTELFNLLKMIQPPNGTQMSVSVLEDKKNKVQEYQKTIELLFKKLKLIYEKCLEQSSAYEYIQIERLIPYKENHPDPSNRSLMEEKKCADGYLVEERRKHLELLQSKNRHLKLIIDNLRNLVWDINTMLAMRKP